MPREDAIQAEGRVIEVLPNRIFRVEMPNGHRILAHMSGRVRLNFVRIAVGDAVTVEMSPYDLSRGCIILNENKNV